MPFSDLKATLKEMSLAEFAMAKTEIEGILAQVSDYKRNELRELNKIFGFGAAAPAAKAGPKSVGERVSLLIDGKKYVVKAGRGKLPNDVNAVLPASDKGLNKAAIIAKYRA